MNITNQNKTLALFKKFEDNVWLSFDENSNRELIIEFLEQYLNDQDEKEIIQQFVISKYFAIIFTGKEKPIIDKLDKGNKMNDKMIQYLEAMENRIITHVDTKIESTKTEIINIVDNKIDFVKNELGSKITDLDTKMTKEFKKVNDRLDALEREATKHGWDLSITSTNNIIK